MGAMLASGLGFVALATCFMGPAIAAAMEHFPTEVRFSGFAFGYDAGARILGGHHSSGRGLVDTLDRLTDSSEPLPDRCFWSSARDLLQTPRHVQDGHEIVLERNDARDSPKQSGISRIGCDQQSVVGG